MGRFPISMALCMFALASNLSPARAPASLTPPAATPPEDNAQEAARRFLGWDDRVAFRAEYFQDGRSAELLLEIHRDHHDESFGATARVFELRHGSTGAHFRRPSLCFNELSRYDSERGVLRLMQWHPDQYGERAHHDMVVEFPMRNEARTGGRLLAWNVLSQSYEEAGTVRWLRLSHAEETRLENLMVIGWREGASRGYGSIRDSRCGTKQRSAAAMSPPQSTIGRLEAKASWSSSNLRRLP